VDNGRPAEPRPGIPLLWRVLATNALVITAAVAAIAFSPLTIPAPVTLESALYVLAGLGTVLVANMILLRRSLSPLRRLTEVMRTVDPLEPGRRIPVCGPDAEVMELTRAFNDMLERLETERREAAGRALSAQEGERLRTARELHDEIGQRLTAVLLQVDQALKDAPSNIEPQLREIRETARGSLEEARRISVRLRPEALDDLGLENALEALVERLRGRTDMVIAQDVDHRVPPMSKDCELVIYRVAQEALTNALRHSNARAVTVHLNATADGVALRVIDDGRGLIGTAPGGGMQGMRERAMLIGARLRIAAAPGGGTEVALEVPPGR
jgi:two-component system sensor histidine kinase UhpB